jgi:branched-chain amino acid transport system substrate-binding protein
MKRLARTSLVVTAAALLAAACGGPSAGGGDEGGPIKVGILADLTGATADVGTPYNEGMLDYIAWRNQQGGIEGRLIEPDSNDYAYKVPQAEELYKRYVAEGAVVIQGWGTSDSDALRGKVAADELPFMSGSLADVLSDPASSPYTFVPFATYNAQIRTALNWINEDSGGTGKVAVLHIDSPAGAGPAEAGRKWIEEQGMGLGYSVYPMPSASNFVALLAKARDEGAQYLIVQHVSTPAAQVAKDLKAAGLPMKLVCLSICADEFFVKTAGADAAEGHIMVNPVTPPSVRKPGHAQLEQFLASKGESLADQNVHYVQGWYTMHAMAVGIEKVLASGEELTGPAVKAALEESDPIDTGGVSAPIDFSATSHAGSSEAGVYQVTGGRMTELKAPVATP